MRKIYTENLPRSSNRDFVDWNKSIGKSFTFQYEDVNGSFTVINYDIKSHIVTLKYLDKIFSKRIENLIVCQFAKEIGYIRNKYKYKINDVVHKKHDLIILDYSKYTYPSKKYNLSVKAYKIKCLNCGEINIVTENTLIRKKCPCPVCNNSIIIKDINSIYAYYPELINYFKNKEDAYTNSIGVSKKMTFICPDCNTEKTMLVSDFLKNGLACQSCSDGISYPNKFVRNVLKQLNLKNEPEKRFDWCKYVDVDNTIHSGTYDNYLPDYSIIIEVDGKQHNGSDNRKAGAWIRDELSIDKQKESLATKNNYYFIRINAFESTKEYLSSSMLNSDFNLFFDLSSIDWDECDRIAIYSNVIKAANLWNDGLSICMIKDVLECADATVIKYLKRANILKLCKYEQYDGTRRSYKTKEYKKILSIA